MSLYVAEAVLKLIGLGFAQYFRSAWRRFEFVVACACFILLILWTYARDDQFAQLLLALALLRIIHYSPALNHFVYQLYVALPTITAVIVRIFDMNILYQSHVIIGPFRQLLSLSSTCQTSSYAHRLPFLILSI